MVASSPCDDGALEAIAVEPTATPVAGGACIRLDAAECLASPATTEQAQRMLEAAFVEPDPVSVRIDNLARTDSVQAFALFCELIAGAAADAGADPSTIDIAVDAHDIAPSRAWSLRREHLARGRLYFVGTRARTDSDVVLRELWALGTEARVATAFWPLVRSPTPLLDAEFADDVLPVRGLQVPAGTAWVSVIVDVGAALVDGTLSTTALDAALEAALLAADDLHAKYRWPNAATRHDAWLNRRVAVELVGIGDWIARRQRSLCSLSALSAVDALLGHAASQLKLVSRRMAAGNTLPAITARNPCRQLAAGAHQAEWRERWQFAIERAGLGHRNLLCVSPWSLFEATRADVRAFNLVPALRHVDVCTFHRRVPIDHWNAREFIDFHRRTWAVMRQNARPALIAEQL